MSFLDHLRRELADIQDAGLTKREKHIAGPQGPKINVNAAGEERELVNLCANNYLGLANHPEILKAAKRGLDDFGFGMASVRFICGTQTLHRELEDRVARYVRKEDAIIFAACFDANGGVFEPLLGENDAVISDALNHASIIDGIRLCKARRYRFANGDMNGLEECLRASNRDGARYKLIVTDGVFSMDGHVANLPAICQLADRYEALIMVDDCHATGHLGDAGRGTPTLTGVGSRIDIITGTFGKTLGGAMGGFVAAAQPIIDLLRQRARPYLFSNSLAPAVAAGTLRAIDLAQEADDRRTVLAAHAAKFRRGLTDAGFELAPGATPIIPVMLRNARLTQDMVSALEERGVYAAGFSFPVVPKGQARIRSQMSAALSEEDVTFAISAFKDAGEHLRII